MAYAANRKALRSLLWDSLTQLGKVDPADEVDTGLALLHLREMLYFIKLSLDFESRYVALALGRGGGADAGPDPALASVMDRLHRLGETVASAALAPQRGAHLARLYDGLLRTIEDCMPALRRHEALLGDSLGADCSREELAAMQRMMLASMDTEQLRHWLYWMIPVLHPGEQVDILLLARPQFSAEQFCRMSKMLEDVLPAHLYRRLLTHKRMMEQ